MVKLNKINNKTILSGQSSPADISLDWFSADFWRQQNKIYAQKKGRASVWFFKHNNVKGVLRHYWRGGLIGKLLRDQYLYLGLKNSRVYQEFDLLCKLQKLGLNVPTPLAAKIEKKGLIYNADIITQAIEGAQSILDVLKQRPLSSLEIKQVAICIAEFHRRGVYHADLNINNILFSQASGQVDDINNKVYLIDFDRGSLKKPQTGWQQNNINRLKRSFSKESKRNSLFYWQKTDWQLLINTYEQASTT